MIVIVCGEEEGGSMKARRTLAIIVFTIVLGMSGVALAGRCPDCPDGADFIGKFTTFKVDGKPAGVMLETTDNTYSITFENIERAVIVFKNKPARVTSDAQELITLLPKDKPVRYIRSGYLIVVVE